MIHEDLSHGSSLSPSQTIATCQRNISQHCWAQHVTCVWPPCCDMLGVVGSNLTIFKLEPTTSNRSQHIVIRWPNACNRLHSTVLRYVALACYHRLAGALDCVCARRGSGVGCGGLGWVVFSSYKQKFFFIQTLNDRVHPSIGF